MITIEDYFGPRLGNPDATPDMHERAIALLDNVNSMLDAACLPIEDGGAGYLAPTDKDTGTQVSGSKGGSGDGGFRPHDAKTGGPGSKHRQAQAVDVYDPEDVLDNWLTDDKLHRFGLFREHPEDTPGWCHLQTVPPGSGRRTFKP